MVGKDKGYKLVHFVKGERQDIPLDDAQAALLLHKINRALSERDPFETAKQINAGQSLQRRGKNSAETTNELRTEIAIARAVAAGKELERIKAEMPHVEGKYKRCEIIRECGSVIVANGGKQPSARTIANDLADFFD